MSEQRPKVAIALAIAALVVVTYGFGALHRQQTQGDLAIIPGEVERIIANPPPATTAERERRDLAAQENMVIFAMFSLLVTSLGTAIIAWQVRLTRRALDETSRATDLIAQQTAAAERNAELAMQAYISIRPVRTQFHQRYHHLEIEVTNSGQSPARNVKLNGHIGLGRRDVLKGFMVATTDLGDMAAGEKRPAILRIHGAENDEDVLGERGRTFVVTVKANYQTVFDEGVYSLQECQIAVRLTRDEGPAFPYSPGPVSVLGIHTHSAAKLPGQPKT